MGRTAGGILGPVIEEAAQKEVADILFVHGCVPSLKVEGKLIRLDNFDALTDEELDGIVKEIVTGDKLKTLETERQVDLAYAYGEYRFRVNAFFQRGHLSVAMRYVRGTIRSMEELGLPEIALELLSNDSGLILMVGPTGSGKSTSLAAMLERINEVSEKHIITIEDPVEYIYENKKSIIEQREIGIDAVSFASALRSTLREAPDVILLGEMRDLESIASAITVAETGHLVLSTIHANNAPGSVDRIIDAFPPGVKEQIRLQLADILLAVFNQRLVPRADEKGNTLIVEVMVATPAIRNAIRTANTAEIPTIMQTSSGEGMHILDDLLVKAVRRGDITKENAVLYAHNQDEVKKGLKNV